MTKFYQLILFLLLPVIGFSQSDFSGTIVDVNGEPLIGATVSIPSLSISTFSDVDGGFILRRIPSGKYEVIIEYLGYEKEIFQLSAPTSEKKRIVLAEKIYVLEDIYVKGTWASEKTPIAYTNVSKEDISKNNQGQDLPFILRYTPSLVVTSDAGAGVGYTGMRIRGTDASRINFTINGIPLNDSESQGVFLVNMPDFASSTEAIQIQRGVGTSTNGAGAFGATVNLQSNTRNDKPYAEIGNSYGTFNTHRHNLKIGTGLLKNKFSIDARLSKINSDGYIDRASSDLKSAYLAGGYYGKKTVIKAITFFGREQTYQSWFGTPESILSGDPAELNAYADRNFLSDSERVNLLNSARTYNFYEYENEIDDYGQDHYQLHWSQVLGSQFALNSALHYTKGAGFFEQFRASDDFEDYGLAPLEIGGETINSGDFIRRRWLDNDFIGGTSNLKFTRDDLIITLGTAFNKYYGDHFGEIVWAEFASDSEIRDRYYDNRGEKTEFNSYLKGEFDLSNGWNVFGDLQFRNVDYTVNGIDSDLRNLDTDVNYSFFNPKLGLSKTIDNHRIFVSAAVANKEPNRGDLIDAIDITTVNREQLFDIEAGYLGQWKKIAVEVNLYNMSYNDQLVLTGALNDVGSPVRVNVPESYRRGIELQLGWELNKTLQWNVNSTLSRNKIKAFTELEYDYTVDFDIIENDFDDVDISFSPNIILGSELIFKPLSNLELAWNVKYVGKQFLDNTGNENRAIEDYLVNDFRIAWNPSLGNYKGLSFNLNLYNFLNRYYSTNGYTFSYRVGDLITENFYYPQAGIHFLSGITLKF